jgi:glycogen(starch) synthase
MQRRHEVVPFDIVQSADYLAVGLFVPKVKGRVHLVRCSTAADLYNQVNGESSISQKFRERLERATLRRADKAYAPSQFIAAHYRTQHGIAVDVLRPPMGLEVAPSTDPPCGLPDRFLLHFGRLWAKTGTLWLTNALKVAFKAEPSLQMVWVGRGNFDEITSLRDSLGQHRCNIQLLYPLAKPDLYAVLQRADAAVLPSLVDNLPNTVIESLTMGVPVIGTRGASIDELVEDGVTGNLVESGDVEGLALAIVKFWRGDKAVRKGFTWSGGIADEMQPERAVENFLKLAGVTTRECENPLGLVSTEHQSEHYST